MAPNKIEDHIREKMQEREINPSADAWAKLEARLGKEEKKRGIGRNTWFAIAASFIGILILASVFLNSANDAGSIEIVEEQVEPEMFDTETVPTPEEIVRDNQRSETEIAVESTNSEENQRTKEFQENKSIIARSEVKKKTALPEEIIPEMNIEQKHIAKVENEKLKNNEQPVNDEDYVKGKIDEVVAEVNNRIKTNSTVTPEEIDALLTRAQREISDRRILNSETNKVDATALLEDVEFELERSFRDKVFDALGESFEKIRTAVAERNN